MWLRVTWLRVTWLRYADREFFFSFLLGELDGLSICCCGWNDESTTWPWCASLDDAPLDNSARRTLFWWAASAASPLRSPSSRSCASSAYLSPSVVVVVVVVLLTPRAQVGVPALLAQPGARSCALFPARAPR